jgi:putative IMPACT (imprinted ancient) family translation regulator
MSQKRKRSQEPEQDTPSVYRSAPIEDRSSKFIGYFSPSLKPKELQNLDEIKSASHKILASRRESNQQSITGGTKYTTDHDDDGEKYAGKTVTKVLNNMQIVGACVVARWYGGVLLGPVRFEHIETCAREAIQNWKDSVAEEHAKKRKLEQDEADIKRLVGVLAERDQSIVVLRQLASEKEEKLKAASVGTKETDGADNGGPGSNGISVKEQHPVVANGKSAIDYAALPLHRLKALEKARDATLSFLLKRIDKAELELVGATGQLPET